MTRAKQGNPLSVARRYAVTFAATVRVHIIGFSQRRHSGRWQRMTASLDWNLLKQVSIQRSFEILLMTGNVDLKTNKTTARQIADWFISLNIETKP